MSLGSNNYTLQKAFDRIDELERLLNLVFKDLDTIKISNEYFNDCHYCGILDKNIVIYCCKNCILKKRQLQ